jgi:hypothetical protein
MIDISKLTSVKNREVTKFVASLIDNVWYGRTTTKRYPILIPKDKCNELRYIFTSKTNDHWGEGVPKKHSKLFVDNYNDFGFWTPFRQGLEFEGILINNVIHVDWNKHQQVVSDLYKKYCEIDLKERLDGKANSRSTK